MASMRARLSASGFVGFVPVAHLATADVPEQPGVYAVIREDDGMPEFRAESVGGWFKGRDPSVALDSLRDAWIDGAALLYVGGTGDGDSGATLRTRLDQLRRYAAGEPVGHTGGRYLWQLRDRHRLLVAWRPTAPAAVKAAKSDLLAEFWDEHQALPFANLRWS